MDQFRLLNPDEIEVKVKKITDKGAALLLYKTARTDMDMLDETVGAENWDCAYSEIKGNLYCKIGIRFPDGMDGERWVYKQDCGIESREDEEGNQKKGEASDAFKRAGFKWGIGRELYTAPFIWVGADRVKVEKSQTGRYYTNDRFRVDHIAYIDRKIAELRIVNTKTGVVAYSLGAALPPTKMTTPKPPPRCAKCGSVIEAYKNNGYDITPEAHAEGSRSRFGKVLCLNCIRAETEKAKAEMEAKLNDSADR